MRVDIKQFLADAVARCLNRCMLLLLPANRRAWGHALVAEQQEISNRQERLAWAAGGIAICLNELTQRICSDGPTWTAGIAFGIVSALVDLHSTTRLAVHAVVVVVRVGSCVLVGKVGMAMDSFACIEFAPCRTGHDTIGAPTRPTASTYFMDLFRRRSAHGLGSRCAATRLMHKPADH
jgi:hypothetical protein